jgi:hypothetical protein
MEYLLDLYSLRITIEMAGGKLIFSVLPLPGAPTVGAMQLVTRGLSWFRSGLYV